MRCKNCGTENDDKRYICENCGSPLYDEEDFNTSAPAQQTQSFNAIDTNEPVRPLAPPEPSNNMNQNNEENKAAEKKSIIVIAILVVLLVAIIASVAVVASTKRKNENTTAPDSSVSQTLSTKKNTTEKRTTETTTEKETTTEPTTTTTTTTTTTKQQNWSIKLVSQGGGTVDGSGSYRDGDNVTITATPDDGYEFDGWYSNGSKISSTMRYSFTATDDLSISAVFVPVSTTEEPIEEMDGGMD